jgi:cell division protein FtsZ
LINITGSASLKLAEVQQACSIIQGAAHEDANIIFGAVMDEKMKDAVKITVIATGFREVPRMQFTKTETHHSFAASHDEEMDFPSSPQPHSFPEPMPEMMMDEPMAPEPTPVASTRSAEVISLETMRSAMVASFEQEDLDVPAFLRKRADVM